LYCSFIGSSNWFVCHHRQFGHCFDIIKYVGAAYLIYLGIRSFLSKQNKFSINNAIEKKPLSKLFWPGVFTNVFESKSGSILPCISSQFIHPEKGITALQYYYWVYGLIFQEQL
jgi:threonine/homoserine/homoserine lactone efflux protein